jgi:predicted DCC family thiol-disulfide oxidoreductase YuxK
MALFRCFLKHRFVSFVIANDPVARFQFASLQGPLAHEILRRHGRDPSVLDTVYVVLHRGEPGEVLLERARAALYVLGALGGVWRLIALFRVLPTFVLDGVYRLVARSRYGIFGRSEVCSIPSPAHRGRFLDDGL